MNNFYLRCRSVTYAQRAQKILEKSGIPSSIVKLPQQLSVEGCGYSIKTGERWFDRAYKTLRDSGFEIHNIYLLGKDGEYREAPL